VDSVLAEQLQTAVVKLEERTRVMVSQYGRRR
jgi:hypothetical protein